MGIHEKMIGKDDWGNFNFFLYIGSRERISSPGWGRLERASDKA